MCCVACVAYHTICRQRETVFYRRLLHYHHFVSHIGVMENYEAQ